MRYPLLLNNPSDMMQDSVTGLLLAGIGHITQDQKKNFLIVDASTSELIQKLTAETETSTIEKTFEEFTQRKDIAILLINQHVLLFNHQFD
jgi:V-type H+-transporting ATPase subunit F